MEHLEFIAAAVRDKNVGALMPTSRPSVVQVCKEIDATKPVVVVEYGPGTGVFTRYLLKRLHPGSTLIAIELNKPFADRLRKFGKRRRQRRPRLVVVYDSAANVNAILDQCGFKSADYVISGIPFSFLPVPIREEIIDRTHQALDADGLFLVYQYSFRIRPLLAKRFRSVSGARVLLNLPPMCLMKASKKLLASRPKRRLRLRAQLRRQGLKLPRSIHARERRLTLAK